MENLIPENCTMPDKWVIVTVLRDGAPKSIILSGWGGSYLYGASWKVSSHIEEMVNDKVGKVFYAKTISGSVYALRHDSMGLTVMTAGILSKWMEESDESNLEIEVSDTYTACEVLCESL